jgi:hypothetical protein
MVYSRFIGGSDADAPGAIAVDSGGRVIVGGRTRSADFPLALPLAGESGRAFLSMLDPSGRAILFASTLRSQPTPYFPGVVGVAVQGTRLVAGLGHYADGSQNVRLLSISLADLGEPPAGR